MINLYAIKDLKADYFLPPFVDRADSVVVRNLTAAVNSSQQPSDLTTYPEDFHLYRLAVFNDSTGYIESENSPVLIARVIDLVTKETV